MTPSQIDSCYLFFLIVSMKENCFYFGSFESLRTWYSILLFVGININILALCKFLLVLLFFASFSTFTISLYVPFFLSISWFMDSTLLNFCDFFCILIILVKTFMYIALIRIRYYRVLLSFLFFVGNISISCPFVETAFSCALIGPLCGKPHTSHLSEWWGPQLMILSHNQFIWRLIFSINRFWSMKGQKMIVIISWTSSWRLQTTC